MNSKVLRIGTRESQLAVWQADLVKDLLQQFGYAAELVYIKSEGDVDLKTPLYEMGVQGIFTKSLDIALLDGRIDLAVHSMKDVPTQLPKGIVQAAVLKRANYKDLLVLNVNSELSVVSDNNMPENNTEFFDTLTTHHSPLTIATSSTRRRAQWLNRYPNTTIENLRGNVNTRLKKVAESNWHGAIFAAAGLERIDLRPENSVELDWMLPAPAQGAIVVVCKQNDETVLQACSDFNDAETALCTQLEKDFLRQLMGGCTTPISALAQVNDGVINFSGSILSPDGKQRVDVQKEAALNNADDLGYAAATEVLNNGGQQIVDQLHAKQ